MAELPTAPIGDELVVEKMARAIGAARQDAPNGDYGLRMRLSFDEQKRAAVAALAASGLHDRIEKLRGAVRRAYIEGHRSGRANGTVTYSAEEDWERSQSKRALASNGLEP